MSINKHCYYNFHFVCDRKTRLFLVLFGAVFFISQHTYAQTTPANNEPVVGEEAKLINDENVDDARSVEAEPLEVRPVEMGVGGNIKLERKYRTELESQFEWHTHLFWESRYVTEGRDNLSGGNLVSVSSEFIIDELNIVPWLAYSPDADYSELNLNFVYGTDLTDDLLAYFGYNHIRARYRDERAIDNEISFDMAYRLFEHVGAFAGIYHSFDADGSFVEMGVKYFGNLNKKIHYSVLGSMGANADYIPDGHNGLNHVQLRVNAAYQLVMQIELHCYAGYNQAINRDAIKYAGDESLGDFFWGGVGLTYLF